MEKPFDNAERIEYLDAQLAAACEQLALAKDAIKALLIMMDRAKPRKLDEALTWKQNDELAKGKAQAFLANTPSDLVVVRREDVEFCLSFWEQSTFDVEIYSVIQGGGPMNRLKAALMWTGQ